MTVRLPAAIHQHAGKKKPSRRTADQYYYGGQCVIWKAATDCLVNGESAFHDFLYSSLVGLGDLGDCLGAC
jgi:hypothetical protein